MGKQIFSVCSFAHLLCVRIVFEEYFIIPFFFFTFSTALFVSILSPKYQYEMTNPFFFQYAFVTSSRQSKNAMHAYKMIHMYTNKMLLDVFLILDVKCQVGILSSWI